MKRFLLILLLISSTIILRAQNASLMISTGTNHFMGELGGGKKSPAPHYFAIRDLDGKATRPTWQLAYTYKFPGNKNAFFGFLALRANLTYALVTGNDAFSKEYSRQARNLTFRSPIYEISGQLQYYFIPEKATPRHKFQSLKKSYYLSAYLFFGIGGFYYNPKAKDASGTWQKLQPLGTEGQYANPDGTPYGYVYTNPDPNSEEKNLALLTPEPYKKFAMCFFMGIGAKYKFNRQWAIGLEISDRITTTDYIDDVSDRYFNYAEQGLTPPDATLTPYFSDKHLISIDEVVTQEMGAPYVSGKSMRGSPDYNDAYILTMVTLFYTIKKNKRTGPPKLPGRSR